MWLGTFGSISQVLSHFESCQSMFMDRAIRKIAFLPAKFSSSKMQNVALQWSLKSSLDLNTTPKSNCRYISFSGTMNRSWKVMELTRDLWGNASKVPRKTQKRFCHFCLFHLLKDHFLLAFIWNSMHSSLTILFWNSIRLDLLSNGTPMKTLILWYYIL